MYKRQGANPMILKKGIEKAVDTFVEELKKISKPVEGKKAIAQVAADVYKRQVFSSAGDLLRRMYTRDIISHDNDHHLCSYKKGDSLGSMFLFGSGSLYSQSLF